jgi:hypothetical protein
MRTAARFGLLLSLVFPGCGGGQPSPAASAANAPAAAGADGDARAPSALMRDAPSPSDGGAVQVATQSPLEAEVDGGRLGPHAHDPGRGPADIRAIVVAHRDEARACYEKSLSAHPGIEGDLVIQWVIDPKGAVSQVGNDASRSQILEPSLVTCIAEILTRIQFAPSPRGFETKAFYPFNFHPRHLPRTAAP